jgi:adenosine deaminase
MTYTADPQLAAFVQGLPKTETHLHIEGACPYELLRKLDPVKYADPPPFWDPAYRYRDGLRSFMPLYIEYCEAFFTSAERYHQAAGIMLANCAAQGCRYVETSFHLPTVLFMKDGGADVVRAIKSAAPRGLDVRVFAGMCHNDYAGAGRDLIEDSLRWPELDGLDLHGLEDIPLEPWTADVWGRARRAGKYTKAHAGEFMGPEFVERILDETGAQRIQHGVRSAESPATTARLVRDSVALDVCPLSNVKLCVPGIPDLKSHPFRRLFDAGVTVTVNSDDPFFLGNSLSEEYYALHSVHGFTLGELCKVAANGFKVALIPEHVRAAHLADLARYAAEAVLGQA